MPCGCPPSRRPGSTLLKRLTMILSDGRVESVLYPVFPPDGAAQEALRRLPAR